MVANQKRVMRCMKCAAAGGTPYLLSIIYYLLSNIIFYWFNPSVSFLPSIRFMHCPAAPELPLPRLSNRLISCICVPSGLARQKISKLSRPASLFAARNPPSVPVFSGCTRTST